MSGNFVQRGEPALYPKFKRVAAAVESGADMVLELPVSWAMSTAQNFALGAVTQLYRADCEKIAFGSESGDIKSLEKCADILISDKFSSLVKSDLKKKIPFAYARENAAVALGADKNIFKNPNDNLGTEYIVAAKKAGFDIKFECIKRQGAFHDKKSDHEFKSSSEIREMILSGKSEVAKSAVPKSAKFILSEEHSDTRYLERPILAVLRSKNEEYFKSLPDITEGLDRLLYNSLKKAAGLKELFSLLQTKRYPLARLRRLVISAFLGIDNSFFLKPPPYLRILGIGKLNEPLLKSHDCPVLSKISDIKNFDERSKKIFDLECTAADLYGLSFKNPLLCGSEYKTPLYKGEKNG